MVEAGLILDIGTIALVVLLLLEKYKQGGENQDRFDDITMGLSAMAEELMHRTEKLLELRDFMPEISLVNQNPLASLAEFIKAIRGEGASSGFKSPPKDGAGRFMESLTYATTEEENEETTRESTDITDSDGR